MHSILLQILRGNWYIDQEYALSAGFLVKSMLENKLRFEGDSEKFLPQVNSFNEDSAAASGSVSKNVAVISISGPLMKHDQECGPAGMDTIGQWIKRFDADESVGSIILKFDCPGGTVSGTETLGNIIRDCSKPIISFVDEMACSGAYWLSSQCDQIIASIPRARIGSIGVMLSFMDIQPAWEKEGVVFHDIVSDLSPDKNKDFKELRSGKYDNYKKNVLNPLAEDFHAVVKSKRSISDESIFKGREVFADEALSIGLIDKIASWEETLSTAFQMAEEHAKSIQETAKSITEEITQSISNPSLTKPQITMKKFERVAAVVDVESFEVQEGFVSLSEEQMESLNARFELAETESTAAETLRTQAQNHQAEIAQRDEDIATRDTRIAELEQEVASVRSAPGAQTATVTSATDPESSQTDEDALNTFCEEHANDPVACMEILAKERPDLKLDTF